MGTVAFCMLPEAGHLNPSFTLARSLNRRGHRVYYLNAEDYQDNIRSQGFESISLFKETLPKGFLTSTVLTHLDEEWLRNPHAFKHLIADQAKIIAGTKEVADAVRRIQPDLFIVDVFLPAVALMVRNLGIQNLFLNPGFNSYDRYLEGELSVLKQVPELVLCPQEFDLPQTAKGTRTRYYVGPSIDLERREPPFNWEGISKNKPLIYCTLGSQSHVYGEDGKHFLRTLVETMAGKENWQLVLAIGTAMNVEDFDRVPSNVLLVRHAPQIEILKRASMMITHGGFGTVKECIFFGVPMIVVPFRRDQPRNAARVVYHRLGVRCDLSRVSQETFRSLIDRIDKTPRFKANVEAMGKRYRNIESSGIGIRIIEKTLEILKERPVKQNGGHAP